MFTRNGSPSDLNRVRLADIACRSNGRCQVCNKKILETENLRDVMDNASEDFINNFLIYSEETRTHWPEPLMDENYDGILISRHQGLLLCGTCRESFPWIQHVRGRIITHENAGWSPFGIRWSLFRRFVTMLSDTGEILTCRDTKQAYDFFRISYTYDWTVRYQSFVLKQPEVQKSLWNFCSFLMSRSTLRTYPNNQMSIIYGHRQISPDFILGRIYINTSPMYDGAHLRHIDSNSNHFMMNVEDFNLFDFYKSVTKTQNLAIRGRFFAQHFDDTVLSNESSKFRTSMSCEITEPDGDDLFSMYRPFDDAEVREYLNTANLSDFGV